MGFLEKIRPKWKHQDPSIRISSIRKMSDLKTLHKISQNDDNPEVRQEAIFQIIKKEKNPAVKKEMLEKIQNQEFLAFLAKNDNNEEIRTAAADRLDPENWDKLMIERAKKDVYEYMRETILRELGDQEALADIAKNDQDNWIRFWAVATITNQQILAEIVQDVDYNSRAAIIQKLSEDQWHDLIADMAANDSSPKVREAAVSKLDPEKYETLLRKISQNDIDEIRIIACGILNDQASLIDYVKTGSLKICQLALEHLDPSQCQQLLFELVQNHTDKQIRLRAVEKLEYKRWQDIFLDLIKKDEDEEIRKAAVEKLSPKKYKKFLAEIAKNDQDYEVRDTAFEKLDPEECQELMADIAKNSRDGYIRKRAVEQLDPVKWKKLISEIASEDEEYMVHQAAREKLESL